MGMHASYPQIPSSGFVFPFFSPFFFIPSLDVVVFPFCFVVTPISYTFAKAVGRSGTEHGVKGGFINHGIGKAEDEALIPEGSQNGCGFSPFRLIKCISEGVHPSSSFALVCTQRTQKRRKSAIELKQRKRRPSMVLGEKCGGRSLFLCSFLILLHSIASPHAHIYTHPHGLILMLLLT